jgi:site-specific recombinase XerD
MHKQIREFLEYIELERGHSQLTIRNYSSYLEKFALFAEEHKVKSVSKIDLDLIKKWRLELHRRGISNKTLNYYMIAIRSFLKYLSKVDIRSLAPEKIELADTPDREIQFLEKDEVDRILEAFSGNSLLELRNRAILEALFSTGLRVSELVSLNRDQINLDRNEFSVSGKGGKRRVVFLSEEASDYLKKYLDKRYDLDRAVFIKSKVKKQKVKNRKEKTPKSLEDLGGRLTVRQVERIVKQAAKRAGVVKKVTPHVMRHSFATDILRSGADLRSVQHLLGHSSITTTQVYTHVTDKHLREIHQKYHHRKNKKS